MRIVGAALQREGIDCVSYKARHTPSGTIIDEVALASSADLERLRAWAAREGVEVLVARLATAEEIKRREEEW